MQRCVTCSQAVLLTSVTETVVCQLQKFPKDVLNNISTTALNVPADGGVKKECDDEVNKESLFQV